MSLYFRLLHNPQSLRMYAEKIAAKKQNMMT